MQDPTLHYRPDAAAFEGDGLLRALAEFNARQKKNKRHLWGPNMMLSSLLLGLHRGFRYGRQKFLVSPTKKTCTMRELMQYNLKSLHPPPQQTHCPTPQPLSLPLPQKWQRDDELQQFLCESERDSHPILRRPKSAQQDCMAIMPIRQDVSLDCLSHNGNPSII